jgi:hypothetical protein
MFRVGKKYGGKIRPPASSEGAAIFRADCQRLGIDHGNCRDRIGIGKTMFYMYGNGELPVPVPVSKLLDSIEAYAKLKAAFDELEAELNAMKEKME